MLPNAFVAADVFLPNFGHGIDARTMNINTVKLFKIDGESRIEVPGHVNTSGAGDAIVFQPSDMLDPGTKYEFTCNGVRDTSGGPEGLFKPFAMTFTTATSASLSEYPVAFEKVAMPDTNEIFLQALPLARIIACMRARSMAAFFDTTSSRMAHFPNRSLFARSSTETKAPTAQPAIG